MGSALLVAVAVGLIVAVQVALLGDVTRRLHPLAVSVVLQVAGVVGGLVWAAVTHTWADVVAVTRSAWWVPLGVAGWLLVAALGFSSARIGVVATLGVSVAVQLAAGLAFDAVTGRVAVGPRPILGVLLLAVGVALTVQRG
jgi:uncharacterized membrane protein YdcZ (DUF606 family)